MNQDSAEHATHERLLQAVNETATKLIASNPENFREAIIESLKILANVVSVDRAYLWENFNKNGEMYCRQVFEWSEIAEPQQGKDFTLSVAYADTPHWKATAEEHRAVNGPARDMNMPERQLLEMQNIKSILLLPLHINAQFWGFIGFDDCVAERTFSRPAEQVLESAGILIVSCIERSRITQRAIDAWIEVMGHEQLLQAVNEVARLLLGTEEGQFTHTVYRALKTLGDCTGADRISIWRNISGDDGMHSKRLALYDAARDYNPDEPDETINFDNILPGWYEAQHDFNIDGNDLDDPLRAHPLMRDCTSLLALPVKIHGEFWGFIALLHRRGTYLYNDTKKGILRSGGMLIASGVIRNEITQSYVEARENALASARSKSEFLSRMSHEIRTPMNAIIGMTTLAKKSSDPYKIKHYLETVDASGQQLLSIINDVLDMSKIDANKMEITKREFNFEDMIRHIINVVHIKAEEKKLDLRLDLPRVFNRMMISDDLRMSQVLINLMSNAVKFTPDYGVVTLRVNMTPTGIKRSLVTLEVDDTGIGIDPALLPRVFESFEQADGSITRQYGGSGLGLAICKRIISLMNGEIRVESKQQGGSRFIVTLEVEWGRHLPNVSDDRTLRAGLRALVIDDAPDVLEYFKHMLEQFGLECDTAAGGEDAVALVDAHKKADKPYDVIFLDWYMPVMNGGETARRIRQIMGEGVLVVTISNADWCDIEQDAVAAGIRYFLPKPVLPSDLYRLLLELAGNVADTEDAETTTAYDWNGRHILLAEDIDINREIIAGMLEETGVTIDNAVNGREAVNMYAAQPTRYQVILMDVQMPILDGLSATREIRASGLPGAADIPILAMTANAFIDDEQASMNAGMNGHIAKPVDPEVLMRTLDTIFTSSSPY